MRALLLVGLFVLAGCAGPAETNAPDEPAGVGPVPDPFATGNLTSTRSDFDLGQRIIAGSEGQYLLHVHGEATLPDGAGPFPLAIIMHGRHGTCELTPIGAELLLQPCAETPATASVASYTGYRLLTNQLASHGIASISVDANNVNDHDNDWAFAGDDYGATARGRLILDVVAELESGTGFGNIPDKLDLETIGLMGHSRGGEGVIRAATLAPDRFNAVFALAPTDFARWDMPPVPFATILPYCDGDVSNLQGAWAYDDMEAGPKHQFLHMGANHNFYNTVWTGDDWGNRGDPYCDAAAPETGRLAPADQEQQGAAMMATFFRYYLGTEPDVWPLMTGAAQWPLPVGLSTHLDAWGSQPLSALRDTSGYWLQEGNATVQSCTGTTCPISPTMSQADQSHVVLEDELTWRVSAMPTAEYADATAWVIRMGMSPESTAAELDGLSAFVEDATGTRWTAPLADYGLFVPPGETSAKLVLNNVYVPLADLEATLDTDQLVRWGLTATVPVEFQLQHWLAVDDRAV